MFYYDVVYLCTSSDLCLVMVLFTCVGLERSVSYNGVVYLCISSGLCFVMMWFICVGIEVGVLLWCG